MSADYMLDLTINGSKAAAARLGMAILKCDRVRIVSQYGGAYDWHVLRVAGPADHVRAFVAIVQPIRTEAPPVARVN